MMSQSHAANAEVSEANHALYSRGAASAAVALMVALCFLLHLEGRPTWGTSGLAVWSAAWTNDTSQSLFDPYSLSHILHGVILYWLLQPFAGRMSLSRRMVAAIALEIGWELLENSPWVIERYRQDTAAFDYTGDSIINSLGDVAAAVAGFAIASRFSWKVSVILFVALELSMLWLARDNLTLNVLMLLHPVEDIKNWQLSGIVPP